MNVKIVTFEEFKPYKHVTNKKSINHSAFRLFFCFLRTGILRAISQRPCPEC